MARKASPEVTHELFRLTPAYDKRGYSPWHWLEANVPQELYLAFFSDRALARRWEPLAVRMVAEREQGDFFYLGGLYAATEPAVDLIRQVVGKKFEVLPIKPRATKSKLPPLFLVHPLETVELSSRAEVTRFNDGRIMHVDSFAFARDKIAGKHFFTAHGNNGDFIVSREFRAAIEDSGLKGLGFEPLRGYAG